MTGPASQWDLLSAVPLEIGEVPSARLDAEVRQALVALLSALDLDRVGLLELDGPEGPPSPGGTRAVGRPGTPPLAAEEVLSFRWVLSELKGGRAVALPRLPSGLPSHASSEQRWAARTGAGALLSVPLRAAGRLAAILWADAFGRPGGFSREDTGRLRLVGGVLLGALRQRLSLDLLRCELAEARSRIEGLERELASAVPRAPEDLSLKGVERAHLLTVLSRCGWRVEGRGNAAETLRLTPSTLRYRMRILGIRRPV